MMLLPLFVADVAVDAQQQQRQLQQHSNNNFAIISVVVAFVAAARDLLCGHSKWHLLLLYSLGAFNFSSAIFSCCFM